MDAKRNLRRFVRGGPEHRFESTDRGVIVDVRALVVALQKHDRPVDGHGPRAALEPDDVVLKRISRVRGHGRRLMHLRPAVLERDRARSERTELYPDVPSYVDSCVVYV